MQIFLNFGNTRGIWDADLPKSAPKRIKVDPECDHSPEKATLSETRSLKWVPCAEAHTRNPYIGKYPPPWELYMVKLGKGPF